MYFEEDHIEEIKVGQRGVGNFKYRVLGRHKDPIHHTNDISDAQSYFYKCRDYWIEQEKLEKG